MVRIEVHGQRLARIRMDGESLGDWQIRGEGILGRRCLCGTVSTPKGHRQSVRTGDMNRDWIIGRIWELEASAQARVVTAVDTRSGCGHSTIRLLNQSVTFVPLCWWWCTACGLQLARWGLADCWC